MKKVVFHVDETGKWPLVIGNLVHMLENYKANAVDYRMEVVANGEAVRSYTAAESGDLAKDMEPLAEEGILFAACRNAMNGRGITKEDLLPFVTVVPAGVVELADLQEQGYAYIKP